MNNYDDEYRFLQTNDRNILVRKTIESTIDNMVNKQYVQCTDCSYFYFERPEDAPMFYIVVNIEDPHVVIVDIYDFFKIPDESLLEGKIGTLLKRKISESVQIQCPICYSGHHVDDLPLFDFEKNDKALNKIDEREIIRTLNQWREKNKWRNPEN